MHLGRAEREVKSVVRGADDDHCADPSNDTLHNAAVLQSHTAVEP